MAGTHLDPEIVEAFLNLYATNVLRDLDTEMSSAAHEHLELVRAEESGDERTLAA
jgi:hypothetical protein